MNTQTAPTTTTRPIDETPEQAARRALEWYLHGINTTGHPPLSPLEVADVHAAILARIIKRREECGPDEAGR